MQLLQWSFVHLPIQCSDNVFLWRRCSAAMTRGTFDKERQGIETLFIVIVVTLQAVAPGRSYGVSNATKVLLAGVALQF